MDFFNLAGTTVSVIAAVIALTAYRLQKRSQDHNERQQFAALIERIQERMAKSSVAAAGLQGRESPEAEPADGTTDLVYSMALYAHREARWSLLAARRGWWRRKLIHLRHAVRTDWLQRMILAIAFTGSWDLEAAGEYWMHGEPDEKADLPQARIRFYLARARFFSQRDALGDRGLCRDDLAKALAIAEGGEHDTATAHIRLERALMIHGQWALLAEMVENIEEAVGQLERAWLVMKGISPAGRRDWAAARFCGLFVPAISPPRLARLMEGLRARNPEAVEGLFGPPSSPGPQATLEPVRPRLGNRQAPAQGAQ